MKAVVIYCSKTGFTRRYAEWIGEELACKVVSYEDRESIRLDQYDVIFFGGGFHAGKINGLQWLKEKLPKLVEKKVVVFATGAMPPEAAEVETAMKANFTQEQWNLVKAFYLWGGLCYEKMSFGDKLMMSVFRKMLKMQRQEEMLKVVSASYDQASKEYLAPLFQYIRDDKRD